MAIPFRDAIELEELGAAGYLKIQSHPAGYMGALILINVRGEPLEFTYTRVETPHTFLWRRDDIGRHAARKITASLLSLCPQVPRLMLCLAEEVGSELFEEDRGVHDFFKCHDPAMLFKEHIKMRNKGSKILLSGWM